MQVVNYFGKYTVVVYTGYRVFQEESTVLSGNVS